MKKISVIIPAWNEERHIAGAVAALTAQDYPRTDFEIVVADNNSTDKTSDAARQAGADKVVFEPEQGTNMARNRGLRTAEGEIIVFMDADCVPPPDWFSHIEKNLSDPEIAATSGPYDYGFSGWKKIADKAYTGFLFPVIPKIMQFIFRKKAGIVIGGNFGMKRKVVEVIGAFPKYRFFGDDAAIAVTIARRVGKVLFDPSLVVKTSPRRFENQGAFRTVITYIFHFLKVYFGGVSDTMESKWDPNRQR